MVEVLLVKDVQESIDIIETTLDYYWSIEDDTEQVRGWEKEAWENIKEELGHKNHEGEKCECCCEDLKTYSLGEACMTCHEEI
jgi:hypothetical protein